VACDENCGAELLECTDTAEWNNAGCLECRKKTDFSEIEIFRKSMGNRNICGKGTIGIGEPRITRICAKCLDMSTPWVKYDFVCRRFRCETRLVPSDIAERKRFCTFGSSPLNLLPGDSLVAVVDFLSGSDLKQLFLTCSAMCTVAERVAKEKVERVNDQYPTGPIVIAKRKDGFGQVKNWTHFEGKNDFSLCAPDDEKAWVGVYHYLEKITKEMFFFGFQMTGSNADKDAVERFINRRGHDHADKLFTFGQVYSKIENDLVPCRATGVSVRGGCLLVTSENISPVPLIVASNELLISGTRRILCRLFCPGSGGARGNRDVNSYRLGSIGLLRTNQRHPTGDGPRNSWAQRADIMEGWLKEDVVVGIEYNADERSLVIHSNSHVSRASRFVSNRYAIAEMPGDLHIAMELTAKAANVAQTLLTVREVDADEWTNFVDHTTEGITVVTAPGAAERAAVGAAAAGIFDPMDAMEAMEVAVDNMNANNAIMRFEMRNRRRERERLAEGDDEGAFHRGHARVMEEGRMIARVLLPRRDRMQVVDEPAPAAAAMEVLQLPQPPPDNAQRERQDFPTRRVVRALRPIALVRAAAAAEEMHNEREVVADREQPWREALVETEDDGNGIAPRGFDVGLVDMDEEVAAGEFVRQIEIQQVRQPAEEPEPFERQFVDRIGGNDEGNAANNA